METQHHAVLTTVARLVDPKTIACRDRAELTRVCHTLADWLRQYIEVAVEQNAEIRRLSSARKIIVAPLTVDQKMIERPRMERSGKDRSSVNRAGVERRGDIIG